MPGIDDVVAHGVPLPAFDLHAPLSGLPAIFGQTLGTERLHGTAVPFLTADPQLVDEWRQRLHAPQRADDGRRSGDRREPLIVGLCWSGDPSRRTAPHRFASLSALAPLAHLSDRVAVRFVSLQQGLPATQLLAPPDGLRIESYREENRSLMETAALIQNLDLMISVDTMIAHLAGALARPTWTLLPHAADWRWRQDIETCEWYPTMRLFRQTHPGEWDGVVRRVRDALENWRGCTK
jgi:hypothetical protein